MNVIAQLYIWPKFELIYLFYISLMILGMIAYFQIMNYLNRKQTNVNDFWLEMQRFAIARKVNQTELAILRKFYDSLPAEEAEFYLQVENRNKFRGALYRFLLTNDSAPTEKEVNLFDKLFRTTNDNQKEVTSLFDISVGEVCALEADGRDELTYVLQKTEEHLLLSPKGISPDIASSGKEAKIYVFRPSSGGYLLDGVIIKSTKEGLVFHFKGKIEKKGEAHLMLLANLSISFSPWPPKEKELDLDKNKVLLSEENTDKQIELLRRIAREQKKEDSKAFEIPSVPSPFQAISERISDRAIAFVFPPNQSPEVWKLQDLWQCEFHFPDGPSFQIKGKIFPTKQKTDIFLFRYVDADEKTRHQIYEEIRKRGGVREILS